MIGALPLLAGCGGSPNALDPRGPAADRIAGHWWLMFWLGLAVYLAVVSLLLYALLRARRQGPDSDRPPISDKALFSVAGLAIPSVILLVLIIDTARTGQSVINPPEEPTLTIDVIGHQFWWEIRYREIGIVTANEIHIPVGQPVELVLTSADVIHSFWVPNLAGKRDLNPGKDNVTWIQADEPGVYRGQCAEFCGVQHALMAMLVIAEEPEAFEQWVADRLAADPEPDEQLLARGRDVFFEAGCVLCHTIQGVAERRAMGQPGPDLTHLGSRRTLASGIIENNAENLSQFIIDPHAIKPGVRMPPTPLDTDDLDALVAYLLSLE